jgi:thiosulfate/3-mercaptopyruvate sulfurtransferase
VPVGARIPIGGHTPLVMLVPSPLVSPESLAGSLSHPSLRVVDVRWYLGKPGAGREAYDAGHIPGSVFVDVDSVLTAAVGPGRHPLPPPPKFAADLAALGIGDEHHVVAYDDVGGWVAARLWWMLDDLGHRAVSVLDGGFGAWVVAGLPVTSEIPSYPAARLDRLADRWSRVIDRPALKARLGSAAVLDARAGPRYRGEVEPIDPVAGHIPTALSAPTDGNLTSDGRFLPPDALAARFEALGLDPAGEVVTSCGSGISACHNALAMRIAGLPDPILYPGSYSDWSTAGESVATGEAPGRAPAG